jgi:hypothetical protein
MLLSMLAVTALKIVSLISYHIYSFFFQNYLKSHVNKNYTIVLFQRTYLPF